ncbi:hypothetical protein M406DRAFT_325479 [Cryphonectria parasitica EP155]|uniref:Uncharacterized protein n=1 Tax=Cryphonectria parasitica (strain ATCC 38755 / EP155) TaxID=660469 RepID=A0A9P4YAG4_CRYP1|nr:uncharacterized protein M406DRAFT_325479 [Cryphonectria parasitica EP155]KAF3770004.1 hypothetical protein M406DRAFT_325479 [Cryphonectria parasitica EP155]
MAAAATRRGSVKRGSDKEWGGSESVNHRAAAREGPGIDCGVRNSPKGGGCLVHDLSGVGKHTKAARARERGVFERRRKRDMERHVAKLVGKRKGQARRGPKISKALSSLEVAKLRTQHPVLAHTTPTAS